MERGTVDVVVTARGAAERTLRALHEAGSGATFVEVPLDAEALGRRVVFVALPQR